MRQTIYIILIIFLTACKTQQLAVIKLNDKFGCINRKGNIVIQPTWDYILQGDKNKQLLVEKDSLYGFIDSKGQIIIRPQYQDADLFSDGLAAVSNGGEMVWNEELQKEIPNGWEMGKLDDVATIIMGQSPEGETYNKDGNGMIFYQGRTDFGHRFPNITTYTTHPKKKALKNDILISVRAPVGDLNIAMEDCAIGRGVGALRSKLKCNCHLFYTLQNLKSHFDISDGEGTIFGSINKDDLHNMEVVYSENEISKFDKFTRPIDDSIKNYSIQNQILTELKDLLLSRLATTEN